MSTIKHKSTTNRKYPFIKLSIVFLFFILLILVGLLLTRKDKIMTEQSPSHTIPVSANAVRPLLVGDSIPELELQTAGGKAFDLKQAVAKQLTILIFYRGGWCPYCNLQLGQIQTIEMQLRQLGYQILAISPDRPEKLKSGNKISQKMVGSLDSKLKYIFRFNPGAAKPLKQKLDYLIHQLA